ncbi:MAG: AMP-binding protein [Phenylobacterium sp.]|uniref:AMP-binding protein n=1 Tax=Phenylobacterium sp. TaxID=1871053 RepID=UPI00271ED230|nr:AMP-binding protein [Phenylobacterium sp.]MDO8900838.1 AMP-binding protein [Phenylobacterium sp.]MDP2212932.1 AMP-binding protein [Phenylobacterium sp.]
MAGRLNDDSAGDLKAAAELGMAPAFWAARQPDKTAIFEMSGPTRTFGQLNGHANRIVRLLRESGLRPGDSVALLCPNRAEFVDVLFATQRCGLRMTPVNWHLTPDEIAYVIDNCEARALFADASVTGAAQAADDCPRLTLKVAIGGPLAGFLDYEDALNPYSGDDIDDPVRGHTMLYSSGTTGRPKGVYKPNAPIPTYDPAYQDDDVHFCTGPAYHASPMAGDVRKALVNGVPTVLLDRWDNEKVLATIEARRVTRSHFVPIMFQRLLGLPAEVRSRYDLSSLRRISHGAAPCPPEVKQAMIQWLGPVLFEYYAGSEGGVGFWVTSQDWLKKPGTVGKRPDPDAAKILDEAGNELPIGQAGTIYMRLADQGGFEYFKDSAKTDSGRRDGYFTMGDVGYFDEDDYLFLTGRSAETIIVGGVNIYPQEIDNELIKHPAVADSCTVGVPHDEYGEEVRAVIELAPGYAPSEALKDEILAYARTAVAKYKIPRGVDFVPRLPRSEAGKIQRNKVRAPYWEGRARAI